ncbi:hypothetical protein [Lentilactobacillus kosonis]|uniref:Uncharacterized protein n=1 Tax=Lentilactobacillus kosonis TaxID=2810561 RepID=A0A401FI21_9LACO|nr:hypothetical protein [Lentilactobacillus kosonis]GAY72030.1 hypothetical protein NBRC111893_176 [Lentilactobacillus kosonis]
MSPNFYKDKGEINGSQAVSSLFLINKNKFDSGEAHIVSQLSIPEKMNAGAKLYTLQFSSQTSGVNLTFNNASFNYLKNLNKNYPDLKIGLESASHTNDKAISDLPEGTDISNMNYTGLTFMTDDGKLPSELKLDIPVSIDLKGANLQLESAQLGDFNNLLQNSTTNQDFFRSMTNASLITTGVYHFQANNDDQDNGWAYNKSFFMLYNPSDLTVNKSLTIKEGQNIDPIKDFNVNPSDGITYVIKYSNGNVVFDSAKDSPDKLKDLKAADDYFQ